jgi:hypothetical protein
MAVRTGPKPCVQLVFMRNRAVEGLGRMRPCDLRNLKQTSFASAEYAGKKRQTRRERFLAEMNAVVPWTRLEALIEPH